MYFAEQLLSSMSYRDILDTLKSIVEEDSYLSDYLDDSIAGDFIYLLEVYDLIWIASDDRILLTQKGENMLRYLTTSVELGKI